MFMGLFSTCRALHRVAQGKKNAKGRAGRDTVMLCIELMSNAALFCLFHFLHATSQEMERLLGTSSAVAVHGRAILSVIKC